METPNLIDKYPQFKPVVPENRATRESEVVMTSTIPFNSPEPVADDEGLSVALPSKFVFYNFDSLFVKPLKARHLAKLAKAHAERSFRLTVEAVSSVMYSPGVQGSLAHKLTVPDFYFVLYFMRLNNFNKTQYTHTTVCNNEKHIEKVRKGELKEETLSITSIITSSQLQTTELQEIPTYDRDLLGFDLTTSTVQNLIEVIEHPHAADADFLFLAQLASYMTTGTLKERMTIAEDLSPDQIQEIKDYDSKMMDYGVKELVNVRCKECGASVESTVSIDAHSFLPS